MKRILKLVALGAAVLTVLFVGLIVLGVWELARENRPAPNVAHKYVDPANRFALTIPAGCRVDQQDDAATTFRCGVTWPSAPITYSYATVRFRDGTRPADLQLLVNQLVAGWHDLKMLKNDRKARWHGRPARVMFASGTDSRGLESKIEIIAVAARHQWCTVSYASPDLQWGNDAEVYFKPLMAGFRAT
ncbi:MAG: hypothetical protein GIX03_09995 [Candidatus Eremiobacteraeota bacterium]|nr:hypothetical protein [Candidatus Eremiobacteraeota bacterium]MBC5803301.1 hypothetical protein [Candidatus Eremiobacteraeota bacterium]MBC5822920.1 hypothetical protein [Candidatus Eremiobacteraeota bacterium]